MLPAARDAQLDFVRLVAEEPSSLYFEDFLRGGFAAWPASYQEQFPGLATWAGVEGLKRSLLQVAGAPKGWGVALASRSRVLLGVGVRSMLRRCRRVLATDLSWPTYQAVLQVEAGRRCRALVTCPLRNAIFEHHWSAVDVVQFLAAEFKRHSCDGVFLPAVDHLGVRLPIARIATAIKSESRLRFVLVDAAQAFCHVSVNEDLRHADFVVAGSHKWMGAYLPTGIAFARERDLPAPKSAACPTSRVAADPLWALTEQVAANRLVGAAETANVAGLFACSAAAGVHATRPRQGEARSDSGLSEVKLASGGIWRWLAVAPDLQSRIRLFRKEGQGGDGLAAEDVRRQWLAAGYIVTGYDGGVARLSPPLTMDGRRSSSAGANASGHSTPRLVEHDATFRRSVGESLGVDVRR